MRGNNCGLSRKARTDRSIKIFQKLGREKMNNTEQCVGFFLNEREQCTDFRPTAQMLADGSVLEALLQRFDARRDDRALYGVMRCLRDSELYIKRNSENIITERGRRYVAAYLNYPDEANSRCIAVNELVKRILREGEFYGVVIEPETHRFLLGRDFMEIIVNLPSEL